MASEEAKRVIELMHTRRAERGGLDAIPDVDEMRAMYRTFAAFFPAPDGVEVRAVDAGGVAAEWIEPADAGDGLTLLYLHGGGYVIGGCDTHRNMVGHLARELGGRALLPDYRLAPEHCFPAAVDDAVAAYRYLLGTGVPAARLAIAGDSAGGGLTIATLVALRDHGVPLPAAAVAISPWVDLTVTGTTLETRADVDPLVNADGLRHMAALYLGGTDPRTPLASPLYADLAGLPPVLVHVGDHETLLDDARRLGAALEAAGGEVTVEVWPEMLHVWHCFAGVVPEADAALSAIAGWLLAASREAP